jgi:predicted nuclease with TOPRIM domain
MSDKTVPLQEFADEHNRLLEKLEAKEREITELKDKNKRLERTLKKAVKMV